MIGYPQLFKKINLVLMFFVVIFIVGCAPAKKSEKIVIRMDNYKMSLKEFEEEFNIVKAIKGDTPEARKTFANELVSRKVLLKEAQRQGLDKEKGFLKMIERFWEQSLLKVLLDRKTREIEDTITVSDKEIEDLYNKMKEERKTEKSLSEVSDNIKWQIERAKANYALNLWVKELGAKSKIKIDEELLTLDKK